MSARTRLVSAAALAAALSVGAQAQAQPRMALPQYYAPAGQPGYDPCGCNGQSAYGSVQAGEAWTYSQTFGYSNQPAPYGYAQPAPPPAYGQPYGQTYGQTYGQPAPQGDAYTFYNPGQSTWRPGLLLAPSMRGYKMDGWYKFLGKPPRGFAWYKIGNEYVLASMATGEILKIVTYPNT